MEQELVYPILVSLYRDRGLALVQRPQLDGLVSRPRGHVARNRLVLMNLRVEHDRMAFCQVSVVSLYQGGIFQTPKGTLSGRASSRKVLLIRRDGTS